MDEMNYRRGFQRVYLTLAGAWFVLASFMILSYQWVWVDWRLTPRTVDELIRKYRDPDVRPAPPPGYTLDATPQPKSPPDPDTFMASGGPKKTFTEADVADPAYLRLPLSTRILWITELGVAFPLAGYLMLFYLFPWVYLGFKS
jgi:hypothetical protein